MEANEQNQAPDNADIPEIEKGLDQGTQTTDSSFGDILGLPNLQGNEAPQPEDTPKPPEGALPPQQDFSSNEVVKENDQVRYQYWQSQAAKLQNELKSVKEYVPMVDYLRNNPEAVQQITPGGKPTEEASTTSQEPEEFPPPPAKPEQPAGFSREEAYNDSASASAKYLDEVDKWRDDIQQYNQLASQYEIAVMRENYNAKLDKFDKLEAERAQHVENTQKMHDVRSYVHANYDLGENVDDFITTMNNPDSLNMDELVSYYKFKKGLPSTVNPTIAAPSSAFQQVKRAQSVPAPMGVQTAQSNAPSNPTEGFMDLLINNDKQKNIL